MGTYFAKPVWQLDAQLTGFESVHHIAEAATMKERQAIISGAADRDLGIAISNFLGIEYLPCSISIFPDGELSVALGSDVRNLDVYAIEPSVGTPGDRLLQLLLVADALHRSGANRVSAVIPYLAYARQERRRTKNEALGAAVMARAVDTGLFARIITVDLHAPAVEGFFKVPVEHESAVPLLAAATRPYVKECSVIVSPDLGGAKLAYQYGTLLNAPVAIVHKKRHSPTEVSALGVLGDVAGKSPIIVDDIISTGKTLLAAIDALRTRGAMDDVVIVASHGLLVGSARDQLAKTGIKKLIVTDSVPQEQTPFASTIVSIASLLAEAIRRFSD